MSDDTPQASHPAPQRRSRVGVIILLIVVVIVMAWGITVRMHEASALRKETSENAVPNVSVIKAPKGPLSEDIILPGTVQAWHEAPIYARTNGYVKSWSTDIGAPVKAGDVLAEIETPEIDAQTHQAEADLGSAEANNELAQSTARRWSDLLRTNSVSKQEADEKISAAMASKASVASAQANLDRLKQTEDFKRVIAPFDGIVTARNIDTGALINAGSNGAVPELFHIAEIDKLRVYVQVPEYDAPYIKPDLTAELNFAEHPEKSFSARLLHTADAIDPVSRTLLAQFEVDNSANALLPGSYVEVHIKMPSNNDAVHLPVNTLLFRSEGTQVATLDDQGKVALKTITIGRDYGKEVEVISGIAADDTVIVNPLDSLATGQKVNVIAPGDKNTDNPADKDKNKGKDKSNPKP